MSAALAFAGLLVTVGATTVILGWWPVAVLGLLWGLLSPPESKPGWTAAVAAGLAWGMLLGWAALHGPVGLLATKVGGIMGLPGPAMLGVAIAFPMLLAGLGAAVGNAVRGPGESPPRKEWVRRRR